MAENAALRRKAAAGREEHQARAMSVAKALRLSTARAADDLYELALAVIGATEVQIDQADLISGMEDGNLLVLLDGPEGLRGVISIHPSVVGGLIQQQTTGRVTEEKEEPRPLTRTDGAMMEELINAVLSRAATMLQGTDDQRILQGFSYGARVDNARMLGLALDEPDFRQYRLTWDVAGGLRQGEVLLCLPLIKASRVGQSDGEDKPSPLIDLEKVIMSVPAELNAVIGKLRLSLSEIGKLVPGDVLALPNAALGATLIQTTDGRKLARAQLGQTGGNRALRLEAEGSNRIKAAARVGGIPTVSPFEPARGSSETGLADFPDLPDLPDLPSASLDDALPDLPPLDFEDPSGASPDLPDLPNLPDLPVGDGATDLPDLPDLSDLDDLPKAPITIE